MYQHADSPGKRDMASKTFGPGQADPARQRQEIWEMDFYWYDTILSFTKEISHFPNGSNITT
jgi:hypothetical protein